MPSITTILLLGVVVLAGVEFAFILARRPRLAMAVALLAAILSALEVNTSSSLAGVNATPQDFVCVSLALALAIRWIGGWGRRPNPALLLVLAVILFNLVRGADQFGLPCGCERGTELLYFVSGPLQYGMGRSRLRLFHATYLAGDNDLPCGDRIGILAPARLRYVRHERRAGLWVPLRF